jgi:hypothetical protein
MIRKLLCVALALGSSAGVLLAADAFTGTWKLDVAKSSFASDDPAPRELTLTFTEQGGHLTQTMSRTGADGIQTNTAWTAPVTGGTVIFPAGQGPNGGASLRVIDDNTLLMTQNLPSPKVGASRTYQVSADGKTLTLIQRAIGGQERNRLAFTRQ